MLSPQGTRAPGTTTAGVLFTWALVLREVCIRSGPEWGVFELDGIQTLQGKLLNTASTNMCIEKGLPPGTENTLFRTWQ